MPRSNITATMTWRINPEQLSSRARQYVKDVVRKTGYDVEAEAKGVVPVDTGNLKNSIQTEVVSDFEVTIGPRNVDYDMYVEFGTTRQSAQPYMTPAAETNRPKFKKAMRNLVDVMTR
jgi:HK97 gp10 family phage protein